METDIISLYLCCQCKHYKDFGLGVAICDLEKPNFSKDEVVECDKWQPTQ